MLKIDRDGLKSGIDVASDKQLFRIGAILAGQSETSEQVTAAMDGPEFVEADPSLARYGEQYSRWDAALKSQISWELVRGKFLANDGKYLKLAAAMNEGGVLFGLDGKGNPLVADGGVEPVMTGMDYENTRSAVTESGYRMFPCSDDYDKSFEILNFEKFTNEPFIRSADKKEWMSSWLERDTAGGTRVISFRIGYGDTYVHFENGKFAGNSCGVRRLLVMEA